MYCRNCGKEVGEAAVACLNCGAAPKNGKSFCPGCGAPTNENQIVCTSCGIGLGTKGANGANGSSEGKSKTLIGILAIIPFITLFGIHYYLFGDKKKFTLNLVIGLISLVLSIGVIGFVGVIAVWVYNIIFGIKVINGTITEDANGNPLT